MHAVSRDVTEFHSACLYMQLDSEQSFGEQPGPGSQSLPMDTGNGTAEPAAEGGGEAEGEEDAGADADEENETQEVRLVPVDVDGIDGGLDSALDRLFQALSDGAALNPDEEEDEEEDEGGFDMSGFYTAESFMADGQQPQMLSMEGATPEQLAMLERYDQMLDASANADGRFDDAEEEVEPARPAS